MFKNLFDKKSSKDQDDKKDATSNDQASKDEESKDKQVNVEPPIVIVAEPTKTIVIADESPIIVETPKPIVVEPPITEAIVSIGQVVAEEPVAIVLNNSETSMEKLKRSMAGKNMHLTIIITILVILLIFGIIATAFLIYLVRIIQVQ
jgi:hypothetical protein